MNYQKQIDELTVRLRGEEQLNDEHLAENKRMAAVIQSEQQRYEALAQELAAAKAAIPAQTGTPGIRQLAAQLGADEKWTVDEQKAFAPFLAQFPNEGSQGIISLGSAWKHGVAYGVSLQPVQQPAPVADIEAAAKAIYAYLPEQGGRGPADHPWQDGGNSHMQTLARDMARAALAAPVAAPVAGQEPVAWRYKNLINCHTTGPLRDGEFMHNGMMGSEGDWRLSFSPPRDMQSSDCYRWIKCEPLFAAPVPAASVQLGNNIPPWTDEKKAELAAVLAKYPPRQPDSGRDAALVALRAAMDCGMVPISSAREGGASAHSIQARVADQIRDVLAAHPANVAQPVSDAALVGYVDADAVAQAKSGKDAKTTIYTLPRLAAGLDVAIYTAPLANVAQVGELSDERIREVYEQTVSYIAKDDDEPSIIAFARAIIAAMSAPAKTDKA